MSDAAAFEAVLKDTEEVQNMYIAGEWTSGSTGKSRKVYNPANNQVIATVADGGAEDADKAIEAARKAFYEDGWREAYARTRADLLLNVAEKLEARKEEIAKLETLNNGKIYEDSIVDVEDAIHQFKYYAGLAMQPHGQTL